MPVGTCLPSRRDDIPLQASPPGLSPLPLLLSIDSPTSTPPIESLPVCSTPAAAPGAGGVRLASGHAATWNLNSPLPCLRLSAVHSGMICDTLRLQNRIIYDIYNSHSPLALAWLSRVRYRGW